MNVAAAVAGRTGPGDDDEEEEAGAGAGAGARTTPLLASSSVVVGKTEEEAAAARALEKQVQAIEQLEGERRLAALPMAERVRWLIGVGCVGCVWYLD